MKYLGDYDAGAVIYTKFTTYRPSTGAPFTLAGTPVVSVYKDNSTTQDTTATSLTVDFDSVTGLHHLAINTASDTTFYAGGSNFDAVITTGTVDSVSAVGTVIASFSLRKTSALKPTTSGRTLDVSATGEAGLDWSNIGSPTTSVNLSGTTVKTATDVETDTVDIQSRLPAALVSGRIDASVGAMAANVLTSTALDSTAVVEIQTGLSTLDAAGVRTAVGLASANLDSQLDALPTAAEITSAVHTTQMTQSYAADGVAPTLAQSVFLIQQVLTESEVSGTTMTVKKLDGSTTAATLTINDSTAPTSITRTG